ncbi:uncharacterized protein LOC128990902 isoform X2 [Macrosteles quadrilineatus]|uniref:uncharacterized protein LOC128990902 isoform X2 n=1 Tax=Macrosteles quadrilineatus TaxID=74068 RepID=UPI0023E20EE6|nr:uncharacterized protein LOC128990902 isoform X2 [Macrosteles quadrilineatus]
MSGGTQSEGPQSNSASPASSITHSNHGSSHNINNNAPKYGTLVPNRIFVGGISSSTTEGELSQLFSKYGTVKATKIIADRAGVSKGYGFVTFESEEEVKYLVENANNVVLRERRLNIAPAIKKQPFSRSFETSSPPPATPNLYYSHNGVPYTFHNGMAFFPPTAHQPALTAVPSTDPSIFPQFGQPQNGPPASYGAPLLVPAPMFLPPQNYPYQPMQLANGSQLVYPGSGSSNTSSAGTPDMPPTNTHLPLPPPHPPQFYPSHQYAGPEGFYPPPYFISYNTYSTVGEYESNEHVPTEESIPSTVSTPPTEMSERSSNRSPAVAPSQMNTAKNKMDQARSITNTPNSVQSNPTVPSNDSSVPVVSWQVMQNHAEDRQLHIRDGRRAFHPIIPPQSSQPTRVMVYHQQPNVPANHPNNIYPQPEVPRNQQNFRSRPRYNISANSMPFIPKFPESFDNNNTLTMNHNFHDKKATEVNNTRQQRFNNKPRKGGRFTSPSSSTVPKSKPTNPVPYLPSYTSQVMQQQQTYERPVLMSTVITSQRWSSNPASLKRNVIYKRQNGSNSNVGSGAPRMNNNNNNNKPSGGAEAAATGDLGGGGDAPPPSQLALTPPSTPSKTGRKQDVTSKMQTLSLGSSS